MLSIHLHLRRRTSAAIAAVDPTVIAAAAINRLLSSLLSDAYELETKVIVFWRIRGRMLLKMVQVERIPAF